MIVKSITELVGRTPLLELSNIERKEKLQTTLLAKLEYRNPAGSVKDRVALAMIEEAEKQGLLHEGTTLIEPTSGNTGIGLAAVAAARGYHIILTMPENMSLERRTLLQAYGAQIVLTEKQKGMKGAVEKAKELVLQIPEALMLDQFGNDANPNAHAQTTGPEIWEDTDGNVDFFVTGVGTGGTISGVGSYLKEKNPNVQIIAIEPTNSPVIKKGATIEIKPHKIQGIGAGFIPDNLNVTIIDETILVPDEAAFSTARMLARIEGLLVGISSGAALWAALELSQRPENAGKKIVIMFPDTGERYLSTELFSEGV